MKHTITIPKNLMAQIPEIVQRLTGADVETAVNHSVKCGFGGCASDDHDSEPRYCDMETMKRWLSENTVSVPASHRKFGDIVVLWDYDDILAHTAVVVRRNVVWHKPSFRPDATREYHALQNLNDAYRAETTEFRRVKKFLTNVKSGAKI